MKNSTASNRKTGRMIAKNLIILLVLVVVVAITIWAWFTDKSKATASGISIQSIAGGVEVSWDDKYYYDELTARPDDTDRPKAVGPAKSLYDGETPSPLKLITGNGLEFFEPYLNRRLGTVLESNGTWKGETINSNNSSGKYIDIDLYFRNDAQKTIYLAGDSWVLPSYLESFDKMDTQPQDNLSAYGNFSKDYISAATRVAFLNADKSDCNFVWAPNANIKLQESNDGYRKVTDVKEQTASSSGLNLSDSITFTSKSGDYYLWLPTDYSDDKTTQSASLESHKMGFTVYDTENNKGLYTYTYTINEPNRNTNPSIIYYINQSVSSWNSDDISYINVGNSKGTNYSGDLDPKVALDDTFYLNNTETQSDRLAPAFYVTGFKGQSIDITLGYNPETKTVIVIGYSSEGADTKTFNRAGSGSVSFKYYEIDNQSTVALVNPSYLLAVSDDAENNYKKYISFSSTEKNHIYPSVITANEMFNVTKTGSGYSAVYTFKGSNNEFLSVADDGTVSFTNNATTFTLACIDGFIGPVLKSDNGRYVVFSNGTLKAVTLEKLKQQEFVTVFTGSSYELITNSSEPQDYKYYSSRLGRVVENLNENSDPPLFASTTNYSATRIIGTKSDDSKIAVATLTKEKASDTYYKAHIVMRIWVEGTDREAKTPLAEGMFKTSFHFVSQ